MNTMEITRIVNGTPCTFVLTESEMCAIWRTVEDRNEREYIARACKDLDGASPQLLAYLNAPDTQESIWKEAHFRIECGWDEEMSFYAVADLLIDAYVADFADDATTFTNDKEE